MSRKPAVILLAVMAGLYTVGFFFPSALNWGFHFLGYLPPWCFAAYLLAVFAILAGRRKLEAASDRVGKFSVRHPLAFPAIAAAVFTGFGFLLHTRVSLLGDSFTLLKNFTDYAGGTAPLAPWNEPLSIHVLYYAVRALGTLDYPEVAMSFLVVDLLIGIGFVFAVHALVVQLFPESRWRVPVFVILIWLPYCLFFYGYIETYAPAFLLLVLYLASCVAHLRGRLGFGILPVLYLLMALGHYISALLGLSLLYLAYREYRAGRMAAVVRGAGAAVLLGGLVLFLADFKIDNLIDVSPISHFISVSSNITPVNAYSQAYTLFDGYHLLDILNMVVMMSPAALFLIIPSFFNRTARARLSRPVMIFLAAAVIPVILYFLDAKLEQGGANDWDAFAMYFLPFTLIAALAWRDRDPEKGAETLVMMTALTLLHTSVWLSLNATVEPNIARFRALSDNRNVSHLGEYTMALRLTRYYAAEGRDEQESGVWHAYSSLRPDDPRGYRNELDAVRRADSGDVAGVTDVLLRWIRSDPSNDTLRKSITATFLRAGRTALDSNDLETAAGCYRNALKVGGPTASLLNNLGAVSAMMGQLDSAIFRFQEAIGRDSLFSEAWFNLGMAKIDRGDSAGGMGYIRKAARMGNSHAIRKLGQ